jgi:hypothetical protein
MLIYRSDASNVFIGWDESDDKFIFGTTDASGGSIGDLTITPGIVVADLEGDVSGNVTGNVTGNVSGTAYSVTNPAQTTITSVGTLSALTISGDFIVAGANHATFSGDVSMNGNVDICGNFYALYPNESIPASAIIGGVGTNIFDNDVSFNNDVSMNASLYVAGPIRQW